MTNSLQLNNSSPFVGLGTASWTATVTGLYTLTCQSFIPWQTSDQPSSVANPPSFGIQDITQVADSAGSLNSTYWVFYTAGNTKKYYVWYNINSAGVDPAVANATGIEVAGATNATANTLAGAARTAIAASTGISAYLTVSGSTSHIILNYVQYGTVTKAANGTASPGLTYTVTAAGSFGMQSGLTITLVNNAVNQVVVGNPSPTQPLMSASASMQVTAGNVISVVLASLAPVDQGLNAVKSIINLRQGN
jgi:hypothetical protein